MKLENKYYLLRHGQTIYQKECIDKNYDPDSPQKLGITEEGREMIKKAAESLKDKNINLIFVSPFLRAKQSAEIASSILGVKGINYDDRLQDIDLGDFSGRPMEESNKFFLEGGSRFENRPKNGENWNDVLKRVKSFLDEIEKKYKNKNILIISHADPIWLMLGYSRGYKNEEQFLESRKDGQNSHPSVGQLIKV